jgi:hypothetical protein
MTFSADAADCPSSLCSEGTCYNPPSGTHGGGSGSGSPPSLDGGLLRDSSGGGGGGGGGPGFAQMTSPTNIDLGPVAVNSGTQQAFTVQNVGSMPLDVTSVTTTPAAGPFAIASGMTGAHTIPVDGIDPFEVTCTPKATGTTQGAAVVTFAASTGLTPQMVTLSCTGT